MSEQVTRGALPSTSRACWSNSPAMVRRISRTRASSWPVRQLATMLGVAPKLPVTWDPPETRLFYVSLVPPNLKKNIAKCADEFTAAGRAKCEPARRPPCTSSPSPIRSLPTPASTSTISSRSICPRSARLSNRSDWLCERALRRGEHRRRGAGLFCDDDPELRRRRSRRPTRSSPRPARR